jgi:hypothetical protein
VAGPGYLLDQVELSASEEHLLELPWHLNGSVEVVTPGTWVPAKLADDFAQAAESFQPHGSDDMLLRAARENGATLALHLCGPVELVRARGPGLPGTSQPATFFLTRGQGRNLRLITLLEPSGEPGHPVQSVHAAGDIIEVKTSTGVDRHAIVEEGWDVDSGGATVKLRGARRAAVEQRPLIDLNRPSRPKAGAPYIDQPPALDGSLDGFDTREPIALDYDDQYRRSEEPYAGPEDFSAIATWNWDQSALYLGLHVHKSEVIVRPPDAPSLELDNEPDDINADGIQVYLRLPEEGEVYGFLIVPSEPDGGGIRARGAGGTVGSGAMVDGAWQRTEQGYVMSIAFTVPEWHPKSGDEVEFDLLVNRMESDRLRRAGQLVWSGGGGWIYLRGDRQDPASFGILELR